LIRLFARILAPYIARQPFEAPVLIPIPPHRKRRLARGWSQTHRLARELERQTGVPRRSDILYRTRPVKAQAGLAHAERRKNVADSFKARFRSEVARGNLILVDDVTTTGATLREAYAALQGAGYKHIRAITIAH